MLAVDRLDHVELIPLLFAVETLIDQIFDRFLLNIGNLHAGMADRGSLHRAGQESRSSSSSRRRAKAPA